MEEMELRRETMSKEMFLREGEYVVKFDTMSLNAYREYSVFMLRMAFDCTSVDNEA